MRGSPGFLALLFAATAAFPVDTAPAAGEEICLDCHAPTAEQVDAAYQIDPPVWRETVHGAAGIGCADCHAGKEEFPHAASDPLTACGDCHAGEGEEFAASVHGGLRKVSGAPQVACTS